MHSTDANPLTFMPPIRKINKKPNNSMCMNILTCKRICVSIWLFVAYVLFTWPGGWVVHAPVDVDAKKMEISLRRHAIKQTMLNVASEKGL